jgi:RimJ/RimL family protein N-acetyltransferase
MKELDEKSRYYFKYHPNLKIIAYPIYIFFIIKKWANKSCYILCYDETHKINRPIGLILLNYEKNDEASLGIAVSNNSRGKGYGKVLMDELLKRSKELGIKTLKLTHDPSNHIARNLYLKYGFEDNGSVMSKSIFRENRIENCMKLTLQ